MIINELGQLIITGVEGKSLTSDEKEFIEKNNIGGVILFKHNYDNPAQLAELVNEIQTLRDEYPLFISVDQEGGRVMRFKTHFTQFPSMNEIGKKDSPKLTFEVHQILAQELSHCGINLDFSPCADVWTNENNKVIGDRAFSNDPVEVEKHVSAAIRGLHSENVLACAKHFPGHGNTLKDSHFDLPFVKKSLAELREVEFVPFYKASKARVEFMMMAHLVVDAIDKELPCTLSSKAYSFLRQELKYKNLIITDDMEMKAIEDNYSTEKSAVMAINAGADILIYRSSQKAMIAFEALSKAVGVQEIKRSTIDDRVKRINRCKKTFLKEYNPIYIPDLAKKLKADGNQDILNKIDLV